LRAPQVPDSVVRTVNRAVTIGDAAPLGGVKQAQLVAGARRDS